MPIVIGNPFLLKSFTYEINIDNHTILNYDKAKTGYSIPKYPIVLCHGFSGFDHLFLLPIFNVPPLTDRFKSLFDKRLSIPFLSNSKTTIESDNDVNDDVNDDVINNQDITKDMGIDNTSIVQNGKYLIEYWNGVKENLEDYGCTILVAKVPPFASIENRATVLDTFIRNSIPQLRQQHNIPNHEPVRINLVAHSMGGLDCRYLISNIANNHESNPPYKIMSLTTISTPHRGTSAADFALKYSPTALIRSQFPSIFQLSTDYAQKFNEFVKDDPNVKYFSYGARMHPGSASVFLITWKIVNDIEGPNDGLVSLKSCKWGNFIGYLDDVDHADLINWMGVVKKTKLALGIQNFNPKYFYMDVADNLAKNNL